MWGGGCEGAAQTRRARTRAGTPRAPGCRPRAERRSRSRQTTGRTPPIKCRSRPSARGSRARSSPTARGRRTRGGSGRSRGALRRAVGLAGRRLDVQGAAEGPSRPRAWAPQNSACGKIAPLPFRPPRRLRAMPKPSHTLASEPTSTRPHPASPPAGPEDVVTRPSPARGRRVGAADPREASPFSRCPTSMPSYSRQADHAAHSHQRLLQRLLVAVERRHQRGVAAPPPRAPAAASRTSPMARRLAPPCAPSPPRSPRLRRATPVPSIPRFSTWP